MGAVMPADASINSQMSMDSNSFSVLSDNQKVYKSTGMTENPFLTEQEKMQQLEKNARLEDCERVKSKSVCLNEEDNRVLAASGVKKRGNPIVTVGAPVLVTSGFSFALLISSTSRPSLRVSRPRGTGSVGVSVGEGIEPGVCGWDEGGSWGSSWRSVRHWAWRSGSME